MADMLISAVVQKLADIAGNLIAKEGSRLGKLKQNIAWVGDEMRCIQSFLEDADAVESESRGLADFTRSVWDLAYDLQDIIETYFPKLSPLRRNDCKGRLGWLLKAKTVRDFAVEIEEIKQRAMDLNRRRETYQLPDASGRARRGPWDPRRTFPHTEEVNIIGLDEQIEELVANVLDHDSKHRVISITGMAGLGKTTLARKVYNSVRQKFQCSAWIYVSQQPNPNELLDDIARQVGLMEKHNLIFEGNLFLFLSQNRYVIVIDDIWQIEPWNALKNGIPVHSTNGSRIIVTSRNKDICAQIGRQNFLHELQPLDEEKSRKLFKMIMAASQDNDEDGDPSQLENIGEKILKRCGGVPLAIVVIAGLLLSRERNIHAWKGVLENIGNDEDQCSNIFALSYKDLPSILKPCFLYFGLFPEDYEISAFELISLWTAEGLIYSSGVRAVEDAGQDCLNHLVGRNLIQVVERRFNGTVRLCRIHDILHDLCIRMAREINFFNTLNDVATCANCLPPRRVTVSQIDDGNYVFQNYQIAKLRALLCFGNDTFFSWKEVKPHLRNFKSLRALIIRCSDQPRSAMNDIVKLEHLHHLTLKGYYVDLPHVIGNLKNLLTLDLGGCNQVKLPDVIWKMKQLRHIVLPPKCLAPSGPRPNLDSRFEVSLPNLQTFYGLPAKLFEANWLHKLHSLRILEVYYTIDHIIEVLSSANSLSQRLEELILTSPTSPPRWPSFSIATFSTELRSTLDLSKYISLGKLMVIQKRIADFPRHDKLPTCLTELILEYTMSEMDPMVTLKKLPRLKVLVLGYLSYIGKKMVCSGEAHSFPQLEVLEINSLCLEEFVAEEGAMPKLKDFTLSHSIASMIVPDRIGNIITIAQTPPWTWLSSVTCAVFYL